MPQFAVLIYSRDSAHAPGEDASTSADIAECDDHAESLSSAAVMTAAWAFTPRAQARSVRAGGITHGSFHDGDEVVVGVYLLEAPDLETAVATAGTNPVVRQGGGVEVRPVHSGGLVTPTAAEGQDR